MLRARGWASVLTAVMVGGLVSQAQEISEVCPLPPSPPRSLGTFAPSPYITVGGNNRAGFTPLGQYGPGTLSLYGPISALRAKTAPILVARRAYGGRVVPELATSFSYPFRPELSPVQYPSRAQVRGSAVISPLQRRDTGFDWVDMD